MLRLAVAPLLCLALGACEQTEPPKSTEKTRLDADAVLLKDIARAGVELEQRLAASIQYQDGLLLVHDPVIGQIVSYVLPANAPWVMTCGIGLSVVLGSSVTGDGSSVGNDVEVHLTYGKIDQKDCAVLGPRLGQRLKAITQGDRPRP
jgi:hypothetical protein